MSVFVSTTNYTKELGDPQADVAFRAEAECLEYAPYRVPTVKKRSFLIDIKKKRIFWEYIAGKYEAINHDDMFERAMGLIKELTK